MGSEMNNGNEDSHQRLVSGVFELPLIEAGNREYSCQIGDKMVLESDNLRKLKMEIKRRGIGPVTIQRMNGYWVNRYHNLTEYMCYSPR